MLITIVLVGFLIVGVVDLKLRKKYNIEKNVKFMDQYIGLWHLLLEVFLCLLFLWYMTVHLFDRGTTMSLLFAFIALLFSLRGLFEYILKREKRRHLISFMYVGLCATLFILSIAVYN